VALYRTGIPWYPLTGANGAVSKCVLETVGVHLTALSEVRTTFGVCSSILRPDKIDTSLPRNFFVGTRASDSTRQHIALMICDADIIKTFVQQGFNICAVTKTNSNYERLSAKERHKPETKVEQEDREPRNKEEPREPRSR